LTVLVRDRIREAMNTASPKMTQEVLAERSGFRKQSIQRFLAGQQPYPPMSFLNGLAVVFGWTLVDLLRDAVPTPKPPPITRPEVLALALRLDGAPAKIVRAAEAWVSHLLGPEPLASTPAEPSAAQPATTRDSRTRRRIPRG
jgi:hypothetical protein